MTKKPTGPTTPLLHARCMGAKPRYFPLPPVPPHQFEIDIRERIRVANRGRRWAFEAKREARFHARLGRIRAREAAADHVSRRLRWEGSTEVAGFWAALRDMYRTAHARALAAEY